MTETADNYAVKNSTFAGRTGLHVETYINSDIMINLVMSYLILSDWIKFKVSTRKFQEPRDPYMMKNTIKRGCSGETNQW